MDYHEIALELLSVMRQVQENQKPVNDSMTGEEFVIMYVLERDGNVTPSEIKDAMGISASRIAAALNNLEKKGIVSRRIDPADRRRILISLTTFGKKQAKQTNEMREQFVTELLEYLGEADAKAYLRIMKKIAAR